MHLLQFTSDHSYFNSSFPLGLFEQYRFFPSFVKWYIIGLELCLFDFPVFLDSSVRGFWSKDISSPPGSRASLQPSERPVSPSTWSSGMSFVRTRANSNVAIEKRINIWYILRIRKVSFVTYDDKTLNFIYDMTEGYYIYCNAKLTFTNYEQIYSTRNDVM